MRRQAGGGRPEEEEQRSGGWTMHAHMRMHNHDMHMEAMLHAQVCPRRGWRACAMMGDA